jgi:hypothetical protein
MHGGGREFEALLEMLRNQQTDEHHASLSAVNDPDAILDPDADELCTGRLAGEYRIDAASPRLFVNFNSHNGAPSQ